MDILGCTASVTQLAAYTHSSWRIFTRLYIELKQGPAAWQEHRTNLKHVFYIIKSISNLSEQAQFGTFGQIGALVCELREIAEQALKTIERANIKIFGVRLYAIGATELLDRTFESLKSKQHILSLVLQSETLAALNRGPSCQDHLKIATMDQDNISQQMIPLAEDVSVSISKYGPNESHLPESDALAARHRSRDDLQTSRQWLYYDLEQRSWSYHRPNQRAHEAEH